MRKINKNAIASKQAFDLKKSRYFYEKSNDLNFIDVRKMTLKTPNYHRNYTTLRMSNLPDSDQFRELLEAVKKNNVKEIEELISTNKDIIKHKHCQNNQNIFIIACKDEDEMGDVKKETIQVLVKALGDDFKQPSTNDHWDAIHYTALNANKEKMQALTENLSLDEVNSLVYCSKDILKKYNVCIKEKMIDTYSNNALNILLKYGKRSDHEQFKECFKLLLEKGVSVYQQDSEGTNPLNFIKKDDDLKKIFNEIKTNQQSVVGGFRFDRLNSITELVRSGNVQTPEQADGLDGSEERFSSCTLLQLYCAKGLVDCVEYILNKGASPDRTILKNPTPPIMIAIMEDHEIIVEILLNTKVDLPDDILLTLQNLYNTKDITTISKYVKMILNHLEKNRKELVRNYISTKDEFDRTPLHYATNYGCPDVVQTLLSMGASLIDKDKFGNTPLHSIDATVLEKFFDKSIKLNAGEKTEEQKFSLEIDYRSLIPNGEKSPESEFLSYMIQVTSLNRLIVHPLVLTFLALKWQKVQNVVYLDLALYFVSYLSLVSYGAFFANMIEISSLIVLVPFVVLLLRAIAQLMIYKSYYLTNIVDLFLIGGLIYIIASGWIVSLRNRNLLVAYSVVLLTSTLGIFQHMRHFSFFTIKVIMLEEITINFFKYIAFYMFPLLAFAFCFFMLSEDKKGKFFKTIYTTVIMFAGNTEDSFPSDEFETNPIFGRFIYVVFVALIVIVLHNLLIGLAVSDLQEVQKQAMFIDKKERSKYVTNIENICFRNSRRPEFRKLQSTFRVIGKNRRLIVGCDKSKNFAYVMEDAEEKPKRKCGDRQVVKLLQEVSTNMLLKDREVENPYTVKSLHERIGKIETLILQGITIANKKRPECRTTVK